ncbi:type III restriction enzyme [Nitrosospira multiformis]|uniref:Type III restriction enzyme n=1 Tax=Nitrosospira multiformis TaxID=1231 RepID=A0A1H8ESX6_9PROT|nr:DEAD/DEAH box helicase family protein [Nitrosospira multiformis]SEN22476.1 type III restriction enzyme [Nitrosospira multiformis]
MFQLKTYQSRTLNVLKTFLDSARVTGVETAFAKHAMSLDGRIPRYRKIPGLQEVPYICLRLPTGGGKTLLAAYSISIAARAYLEEDNPIVLWLVPSNTIRIQTLETLRNSTHLYRQVIDEAFEGKVSVFDITELELIRPKDLQERVCVVVATLQTLRVDSTDGRDVYAHKEALESHFAKVSKDYPGLERLNGGEQIKFSFANLLNLHRPLVIMDEAHNARTKLTFEVLSRVAPACIIELTATPDTDKKTGSNVLHRVSASELKAEDMIKLPIVLTEHNNWQEAVHAALETRARLAAAAAKFDGAIRPILLLQAENKDKEVNVEVLKVHLVENEGIDENRIAIATGAQRGLDGIDLFDPACIIEIIITVQALKEGWDCSFAYVFCSVANIRSSKDVEQLLGRVLRMPYARRRAVEELNRAYAHVSSPSFAQAANDLKDALVSMGFEREEVETVIQPQQDLLEGSTPSLPLVMPLLTLLTSEKPDLSNLSEAEQSHVEVIEASSGNIEIHVKGELSQDLAAKLVNALPKEERAEAQKTIDTHRHYQKFKPSPSEQKRAFKVPRLCVWVQGELEIAERELFLDENGWNLLDFPPTLPEFRYDDSAKRFIFDVDGDKVVWNMLDPQAKMTFGEGFLGLTLNDLVRWLDKQVRQPDISQITMLEFLRRVVTSLCDKQGFDLTTLLRAKFILAKVLIEKIKRHREEAYAKGYQETLFGPTAAVETSFTYTFSFDPVSYPANWLYSGSYRFQKHYYALPGELEGKGEEFECAFALDSIKHVKYWVRNLSGQPRAAFWLPTSSDRFYPDFVALLEDNRLLVVEYKGAAYASNDDSKEKRQMGELWEKKSNGKGLFLMAEKKDEMGRGVYDQLSAKIR